MPSNRYFHRCKRCNCKAYAPATRCPKCGSELYGIRYPRPSVALTAVQS